MLKKLLFALGCFTSVTVYADTYYGPTELSNQKFSSISVYGPARLKQMNGKSVTVMGPLEFTDLTTTELNVTGPMKGNKGEFGTFKLIGPLSAREVQSETLDVTGPVQLTNSTIKKESTIIGPLNAQKSQFEDITITTDEMTLENSKANNILLKSEDDKKTQILKLKGNTLIKGNVVFESKKGKIIQDKSSKIEGKIEGAVQ